MTFGSFSSLCAQAALPLCSLLGPTTNITTPPGPLLPTTCTARSIELANTIIFQAATDFVHIVALGMTAIMILHVRSKFTAVGRKEILTFFYIYLGLTIISLVLDAGVLEARNSGAFPWFVAVQNGLASALCISLLVNGFVGFQLYEDGTTISVWLLRLSSLGIFVISFAVSLLTFKSWAGLSPTNTTGLFIVLYVINAIAIFVYLIMQILLVVNTLQDRWPLGDLAFGVFFLVGGQVLLYQTSTAICEGVSHYLDGLFFATVCNLLAVMMIYKYWDSITREDLEFSVGTKVGSWTEKGPLLAGGGEGMGGLDGGRESYYDLTGPITREPASARNSTYDLDDLSRDSTSAHHHSRSNSHGRSPVKTASRPGSQGGSNVPPTSYRQSRSGRASRGQSRERQTTASQYGGGGGGMGLLEGPSHQRGNLYEPSQTGERRSRYGELIEVGAGGGHSGHRRDQSQGRDRRRSRFDTDGY